MDVEEKKYYSTLNVTHEASEDEIKRSFRSLALQFHPDRTNGDPKTEERFKEINEAYAVLSDPEKRRHYDDYGHTDGHKTFWTGYTSPQRGFGAGSRCCGRGKGLGNLFAHKGTDSRTHRTSYRLPLTPEEARQGTRKDITFHFKGVLQRVNIRTPAGLKNGSDLFVGIGDLGASRHEIVFRVSLVDKARRIRS